MNIDVLLNRLINPSDDPAYNHDAMMHAAQLIRLMQDRIAYLCDLNQELQDHKERLILDLGLKDQGYIK